MGVVYEARDQEGRRVALKTLKSTDPEQLYRLKREFRSLARITHDNLVRLHELSGDDSGWYLTMEFVPGVDFMTYCRQGRDARGAPDIPKLRTACAGLFAGVRALHAHGVLHRDLKPSNVIVTPGGRVVIVDFGLACALRSDDSSLGLRSEAAGTAAYMAPEQVEATSPLGPPVDWYAVGVMLFEVLAGRRPFEGPPFIVLERKLREAAPSVLSIAPQAPPDLAELCDRLLEREPKRRGAPPDLREPSDDAPRAVAPEEQARPRLVGRAAELERLRSEWLATFVGTQRVVTVRGESGLGKTALVREFLALARQEARDTLVLNGRCYPRESIAYRAMDEVMDQLGAFWKTLPSETAAYLMPREPEFLLRAFPTLARVREVQDGAARRPAIVRHDAAYRCLVACREVFQRLARLRSVIITLDDVQWIDPDSVRLLEFVTASEEAPAVLVVLCTRPTPAPGRQGHVALAARGSVLELEPLADPEMRQLIESRLVQATEQEVAKLARDAIGNPFFGVRLAQCARRPRAMALPGLGSALAAQLSARSPLARDVLELLSVAATPLWARIISGALGVELDSVYRVLGELESDDLVGYAEPMRESRFELYHDRIREAVCERMEPARRQSLHRALALEFEAHVTGQPEECARHFASAGDLQRAFVHARRAAELASLQFSFERAAEYYRMCLALGELPPNEQRALRAQLADALAHAGHGLAAAEEYLASARGAEPLVALSGERRAAEEFLRAGYLQRGFEVLELALRKAGLEYVRNPLRRALLASWRRWQSWCDAHLLGRARTRTPELLVRIDLCAAAADCLAFAKPAYTRHYQKLHVHLTEAIADPERRCRALATEAVFGALGGHMSEPATRALQEAQRLASLSGDDRALGSLAHYQAMIAYYQGQWQVAFERSVAAERRLVRSRSGTQWEIDNARLYTTAALQIQGRIASLSRRRERWLEQAEAQRNMFAQTILLAGPARLVRLARDEPEGLRADLRAVMPLWPVSELSIPRFWELEALTDVDLYQGRGEAALARFGTLSKGTSIPLVVRVTRVKLLHAHGRAAIAAAIGAHGADGERLALAGSRAALLEQEGVPWAHALATMLRAGIAAARRRNDECRQLLDFAERQLVDAGMTLDTWVVRHWRARLLAGSVAGTVGGTVVSTAATAAAGALDEERGARCAKWFANQGVRDVGALVAMRAPGANLY
jgi:hypothetical protein